MSGINEVRGRLHTEANAYTGGQVFARCRADDVNALLADHARLQAAHADSLKAMRQAVIALAHAQQNDPVYLRAYGVLDMAIDAAKAVQP